MLSVAVSKGDANRLGIWIPRSRSPCIRNAGLTADVPSATENPHAYLSDRLEICERFGEEVLVPISKVFKVCTGAVFESSWDLLNGRSCPCR